MDKSTKTSDKTQEQELSSDQIREIISQYREYGLNAMPVKRNKHPLIKGWSNYGDQMLPQEMIEEAIERGADAVGIICGASSGGLVALDFDNKDGAIAADTFITFFKYPGVRELIVRIQPIFVLTPSMGYHILIRCPEFGVRSMTLAQAPASTDSSKTKTTLAFNKGVD